YPAPMRLALSQLLGSPVLGSAGAVDGRVREVALAPQDHPAKVAGFIVRTKYGDRWLHPESVVSFDGSIIRAGSPPEMWLPLTSSEGYLLLERDLLDQQIIDVHGRKVVRVNDVDLVSEQVNGSFDLKVSEVEVGP